MSYLPMGDVASSEFNATKYPGIVKPSTPTALAIFKDLQAQLNRVASVTGNKVIMVDGDIGPGTVALFAAVKPVLMLKSLADAPVIGMTITAPQIAQHADVIARVARSYADGKSAPAKVPAPAPTKPPTLVNAAGQEFAAPTGFLAQVFGRSLSSTETLIAVGVFGGIGYMLYTKAGKKRRRR